MAGDSLSYNLGLAAIPETRNPELFPEFVRLYNAVKIVAEKADIAAGTFPGSALAETPTPIGSNLKLSGILFYEDMYPGTFVRFELLSGENQARKSSYDAVHGFVSSNELITAGSRGEITLFGIYPFGGGALTPCTRYTGFGTNTGQIIVENLSASPPNQYIGYALTPDLLFFVGKLN